MALKEKAEIIEADGLRRIVTRIAHEIVERNKGVDDLPTRVNRLRLLSDVRELFVRGWDLSRVVVAGET